MLLAPVSGSCERCVEELRQFSTSQDATVLVLFHSLKREYRSFTDTVVSSRGTSTSFEYAQHVLLVLSFGAGNRVSSSVGVPTVVRTRNS
jgi:hypothetical protein